jgi:signal transduction histidine kinase
MVADSGRLAAVRETALLDTPAEQAFDRLTRLATRILGVPISLVSLVDRDRDFWKSCVGVPEPYASEREIRLKPSFCQHAITSRAPLIVNDATLDPAFANFPAVATLGVRAYLGIPLVTDDGVALGSFCVLDMEPRQWTADDVELVTDLAAAAMTEIELRASVRTATDLTSQLQEQAVELEQQMEEVRATSDQLEQSLGSASMAQAAAEAANQTKATFLATMSHELRTPLNAISGHIQLIEMGIHGPVTPKQREALDRVMSAQYHLLGLINDVLNFAKLGSGTVAYDIHPVVVAEVIADAASMLEEQMRTKGLTLVVTLPDDLVVALADRDKLLQILINLLSNSMKFTPAGGKVMIETTERADGDQAEDVIYVRVTDNGIGIPMDKLNAVFEPFVQVSATNVSRREGTGLGLSISRDLARGMGGDLRARSKPGEGSAFTVGLPAARG